MPTTDATRSSAPLAERLPIAQLTVARPSSKTIRARFSAFAWGALRFSFIVTIRHRTELVGQPLAAADASAMSAGPGQSGRRLRDQALRFGRSAELISFDAFLIVLRERTTSVAASHAKPSGSVSRHSANARSARQLARFARRQPSARWTFQDGAVRRSKRARAEAVERGSA